MAKSAAEVHELFRAGFDSRARIEMVRCAERSHAAARRLVRSAGFARGQARDVMPYVWRADYESRIRSMLVPGVAVRDRTNTRGTSNFVELTTDTVTLTGLTRSRPPKRLPKALYRETRAEGSQLTLAGLFDDVGLRVGNHLYGVFIYGGNEDGLTLGRVYFPVPNARLQSITPIDLLAEYGALGEVSSAAEEVRPTEQATEVLVALKRKLDERSE